MKEKNIISYYIVNASIGILLLFSLLTASIQKEFYLDYFTAAIVVYLVVKKGRSFYSASGVILSMTLLQYLIPFTLMWLILNDPTTAISYQEVASSREVLFIFNVFTLSFLFGNLFAADKHNSRASCVVNKLDDSRLFYVGLLSIFLYSAIAIKLGFFYHIESGEFDVQSATNYGLVMYLLYIAISIFIVLYVNYRIFGSRAKPILVYSTIFFCCFLPSGMRRIMLTPILFIVLFELSQLNFEFNFRMMKVLLLGISALMLLPLLQILRTHNEVTQFNVSELFQEIFSLLIRRLSDYIGVTYIQDHLNDGTLSHIGFSDLYEGIAYLMPTFIRPEISLPYTYDAILSYNIGFRSDKTGSSPLMLIGELLLRGGFLALVPISIMLGVILAIFDNSFNAYRKNQFYIVVFGILFYELASLHAFNIVKICTVFTRHLFIASLFAMLISKFARKNLKYHEAS